LHLGGLEVPVIKINIHQNLHKMNTSKAIVAKISDSKKTMLVGVKSSNYQIGYRFGWASTGGKEFVKGAVLEDFNPTGQAPISKDGEVLLHKDGTPVMAWQF